MPLDETYDSNVREMFTPGKLGALDIKNRVIMPALTRCRCTAYRLITPEQVEYYSARSAAGLIITEPCAVSSRANGFRNAAQYNAVRLLDYNVGRYMEMARESGYFDNTLFVFFGDHNNRITTLKGFCGGAVSNT